MGFKEPTYTPCGEEQRCYYEDWHYDKILEKKIKCCRVLDYKEPYPSGKCPFYKPTKNSYSGSYEGVEYSPQELNRIEEKEQAYKIAHGIIGRRGGKVL